MKKIFILTTIICIFTSCTSLEGNGYNYVLFDDDYLMEKRFRKIELEKNQEKNYKITNNKWNY